MCSHEALAKARRIASATRVRSQWIRLFDKPQTAPLPPPQRNAPGRAHPNAMGSGVAASLERTLDTAPLDNGYARAAGWRFGVIDVDGRRVDKVLATRSGYEPS